MDRLVSAAPHLSIPGDAPRQISARRSPDVMMDCDAATQGRPA